MAKVLVIEDNAANLELMTYLLEAFGHTPLGAGDGINGLAIARREAPDLIVCDIQLPDLDGYSIAQQLKADASLRDVPLVAVTAFAMVGDRDHVLRAGFDGYLAKPIVPETFVAQVESFLPAAQRFAYAPAAREVSTAEPSAFPTNSRATILAVDDVIENHELLRSILEPFGYMVVVAANVRDALTQARETTPDLVVSDMHMPEQSGFDLLRAFRADSQLRRIKIIIHSATIRSESERRQALELGATAVILRPMEPQTILIEIEAALAAQSEQEHGEHSDT